MKAFISLAVVFAAFNSQAFVSSCDSTSKLECTVKYYSKDPAKTSTEVHTGSFEMVNWDEPSEAYCEASVAFNKNDLYITAGLTEPRSLSVAVSRKFKDGTTSDYYSAAATIGEQNQMNMSLSLAPNTNAANIHGVDVYCKILN